MLVRMRIPDLRVNDIVKYRHPETYILESLIQQVVRSEVVPELLVELADQEDVYLCFAQSERFRSIRASYHILNEVLQQEIRLNTREFVQEYASELLSREQIEQDPFAVVSNNIADETLEELCRETLQVVVVVGSFSR